MPEPCEDCGRSMHWQPWIPWGTKGDASAAQGAEDREYPWGRSSAARRAVVVSAHLCRGCFSATESGTPRFLHGRPRRFLHPLL